MVVRSDRLLEAKQFLGLLIHQLDLAVRPYGDHGIRRQPDEIAEHLFGLSALNVQREMASQ